MKTKADILNELETKNAEQIKSEHQQTSDYFRRDLIARTAQTGLGQASQMLAGNQQDAGKMLTDFAHATASTAISIASATDALKEVFSEAIQKNAVPKMKR